MTRRIRAFLLIAAVTMLLAATPSFGAVVTTAPVNDLLASAPVGGGAMSMIVRDADGITVTVHTQIEPGTYTMWLLIWNDPSRCTNTGVPQCLPPPAGGNDAPDSVAFGTGQVVPQSGRGQLTAKLRVGDSPPIIGGIEQVGLTNPMGAEIHAVLRHHGPALPDALEAQITTVGGGCDTNECVDLQGAVHSPGAVDPTVMRLDAIKVLLDRIALRQGLNP